MEFYFFISVSNKETLIIFIDFELNPKKDIEVVCTALQVLSGTRFCQV